jgi:hypothetical protein
MAIKVELRAACTSTGGPRSFWIGGADMRLLRDALTELDALRIDSDTSDAVLVVTDEANIASGAWSCDGIVKLNELFSEEIGPISDDPLFELREAVELAADPPDPFFLNAEAYVRWQALQPREPGAERPDRWDLLASHGRAFVRDPRPDDVAKGPAIECFGNAAATVSDHPGRFAYVEGIAGGRGGPGGGADLGFTPHAWVTPGSDRAVEVTWLTPPKREPPSYFGIVFSDIELVKGVLENRGGYGLFGKDGSAEEITTLRDLFDALT